MALLEARTVSISINRPWRAVYDAVWRPEAFAHWASGLADASLQREDEGEVWTAQGSEGPVRIRFTGRNEFGVMDHAVDLGGGRIVHVPLRIVANGEGCEVLLTLFRQPEMDEAKYAADEAWVRRDLAALKRLAEALPRG